MKLPKICMVSDHCCMRVFKESKALRKRGYRVESVASVNSYGWNMYDSFHMYLGADMLKSTISGIKTDIFHVHNEPDWIVRAVREATNKPIVFDIHDLSSLRWGEVTQDELDAFEAANAFIHVSEPIRAIADETHASTKPSIVLHPYVNEDYVIAPIGVGYQTIVYEGGIATPYQAEHCADIDKPVATIRNIAPAVEAFVKNNYGFHIFAADTLPDFAYENLGAVVIPSLPYTSMLSAIRSYSMGYVGSPHSIPLMEHAMPNKLFEYISQGCVPIVQNASESGRFVEEHEVGFVLPDLDSIGMCDPPLGLQVKALREDVLKKRHLFTMEANLQPLCDLYDSLL